MSGMYDLMFPDASRPSRAALLMTLLNEGELNIGRFRDAWLEPDRNGKPEIMIYTRNGGGNRQHDHDEPGVGEEHCTGCVMEKIVHHPQYLRDEDDGFDCTYARIWFRMPVWLAPEERELLARDMMLPAPIDPDERWAVAIENLGKGPLTPDQRAFGERLAGVLTDLTGVDPRQS
jgi:hypothetical protein